MRQYVRREHRVDWTEIRSRLARARLHVEETSHPSPERARAIMEARARDLARLPPPVREIAKSVEVVAFRAGSARYALETRYVREIVRPSRIIGVPGLPAFMRGLVPLHGDLVLAAEAAPLFGATTAGITDFRRMIVVGRDAAEFGLLVDDVEDVIRLWGSDLQPLGTSGEPENGRLLRGIARDDLVLIDGARLMDDPRILVDDPGYPNAGRSPAITVPDENLNA